MIVFNVNKFLKVVQTHCPKVMNYNQISALKGGACITIKTFIKALNQGKVPKKQISSFFEDIDEIERMS